MKNDHIKIGDFGEAKFLDDLNKATTRTGTTPYMSPELILLNFPPAKKIPDEINLKENITFKSDIW